MNATLILASAQAAAEWPKSGNWPLAVGALATLIFIGWTYSAGPVAARSKLRDRNWAILYGADGRRSTSKLTAFTWTAALLFGGVTLCAAALWNKVPLADIGLDALPEQYLVLLAVPYGSLVAAKLITQTKVESQRIVKAAPAPPGADTKTGPHEEGGFTAGDRGQKSLQDVQYLTFNALLLIYFVVALCTSHALPELPDWLVGLTGASAATFVAAKAVESEQPEIAAITQYRLVSPSTTAPSGQPGDHMLQVRGKHLHQPVCGWVHSDGKPANDVTAPPPADAILMEGAQFKHLRECVTVNGHEVANVEFLGEQGLDVTLVGSRSVGDKLTVILLGGIILSDPTP